MPRTVDGAEFAVRAVLGQQVSTAAARTHAARLVTAHGVPVEDPEGGLTHLFPTAGALAGLDPEALALPRTRRTTLTTLVAALAEDRLRLDTDTDWERARAELAALPGFGPWTVESIAMRALGDPDAFLPTDLGIRRAAERLGLPSHPRRPHRTGRRIGAPGGPTPCSTSGRWTTTPSTTCPPDADTETRTPLPWPRPSPPPPLR